MDIDVGQALETDFVHLRDELGEQELEYLRRTRAFVRDEVLPVIGGYWERAEFPWELARRMGELELIGEARAFGKGVGFGVGLVLLGFVFYPLLAFGDAKYQGAPQHG